MISEKTKHTSWMLKINFINLGTLHVQKSLIHLKCEYTYTNTTSRITLSNLRYSQHVFISKSTKSSRICTVSIDLYLVKDSFIVSLSVFLQNFFSWKHYGVCLYLLCYSSDRYYVLIYLVTQLSCVIDYYTISKRGYLSSILWYM